MNTDSHQRCACGHIRESHLQHGPGEKPTCAVDKGVGCGCREFKMPSAFEAGVVYNLERIALVLEAAGDQSMRDRLESTATRLRGR